MPKGERKLQSHEIAKRVRAATAARSPQRYGARIKVAEVPPGPPVLQTLVAEVYGPTHGRPDRDRAADSRSVREDRGVVDVDWYVEDDQPKYRFVVDHEKAALNGISEDEIARDDAALASAGDRPACCTPTRRRKMCRITVRLDRADALRSRAPRRL